MKPKLLFSAIFLCLAGMAYGQWTYTELSSPKKYMGVTSYGDKVYFAGGSNGTSTVTTVESYDVEAGEWANTGNLSLSRMLATGTSCGTKLFFAGGATAGFSPVGTVDIYDIATGQWSAAQLQVGRFDIAAVSHGDKVFFAGGCNFNIVCTDIVDIYDMTTNTWSFTYLSMARAGMAYAVVGDKAIFAGGFINGGDVSNRVDIYNFSTNTWSTANLSQARVWATAVTVGDNVLIAGGIKNFPDVPTDVVDIYNSTTGTWTTASLFEPRAWLTGGAINGKAYFAGGSNVANGGVTYDFSDIVDILDENGNTVSYEFLATPRSSQGLAVGNHLVVAGGTGASGVLSSVEIFYDPPVPHIIHVPGDYPTIQAGINAAAPGDTVLVADGIYHEQVNFLGKKPLMVASEFLIDNDPAHIENTIIDGSQIANPDSASVVYFISEEDTTSVINGFTICHGKGTKYTFESGVDHSRNTSKLGTSIRGGFSGEKRETFVDLAGGGIFISGSGAKIINNHITDNHLTDTELEDVQVIDGAGIATQIIDSDEWVVIGQNVIDNNSIFATKFEGFGAGISIGYNTRIVGNTVSDNITTGTAAHAAAGGMGFYQYPDWTEKTAIVEQNLIQDNVSESAGSWANSAGVFFQAINGKFTNNIVEQNVVTAGINTGGGAGLIIFNPVDGFLVKNNVFKNNTSNLWAGGFSIEDSEIFVNTVLIENNLVINNSAKSGAGFITFNVPAVLQNNVFLENTAQLYGGAIYLYTVNGGIPVGLINNTISGNSAAYQGGGLYLNGSEANVINTVIWGNTAPTGPSIQQLGGTLEVHYSDVEGADPWPGTGNLNCFPSFLEDGYHLHYACQLLNSGIATLEINGVLYKCPEYDIDGEPRPFSGAPEMGADELMTSVSIKNPVAVNPTAVTLYPNPANDWITITAEEGIVIGQVKLTNNLGQEVYTGVPENSRLDVSRLSPGVYILSVVTNRREVRQKVIIE